MKQPKNVTLEVSYVGQRWQTLTADRDRQVFVGNATVEDFPVPSRKMAMVTFTTIDLDVETTPQSIMDDIAHDGRRLPCRAEAETYLDYLRHSPECRLSELERGFLCMAICNAVQTAGGPQVAVISQHNGGRFFFLRPPNQALVKGAKILVVLP